MDALSDVLQVARLKGGVFLHADFTEPWCMAARMTPDLCAPFLDDAEHLVLYHYVVDGGLTVKLGDDEAYHLGPGDIIMLPHNDLHVMGSHVDHVPTPGTDVIQPSADGCFSTINLGGGGQKTRVVCGYLGCDRVEGNPLLAALPAAIQLHEDSAGATEWIRATFQYAADEMAAGRAGSAAVLAKLSELLFVEAIRLYAEGLDDAGSGWFAGLKDPFISRALGLMHGSIDRAWSVDVLSEKVGLSRSALTDRFQKTLGEPPMQYLASWRMQVASQMLRNSHASLGQIARDVGYESEAAFSRAFKRRYGTPPATWRKQAGASVQ